MSPNPITIAIVGDGVAAHATVAACATQLGAGARIIHVSSDGHAAGDLFYGDVTSPTAYDFFRMIGLDERTLVTESQTSFSYGTRYDAWPGVAGSWVQSYHLPLPVLSGVSMQHVLTARAEALGPYLISTQAALRGVFAHPPSDPRSPLSRAEYGYHVSVADLTRLLATFNARQSIDHVHGDVAELDVSDGNITSLRLNGGGRVTADLYIDCTGTARRLVSDVGPTFGATRKLVGKQSYQPSGQIDGSSRVVVADVHGWQSRTPLQRGVQTLTIRSATERSSVGDDEVVAELGCLDAAWKGNCVAIGQAACVMEPLTPAPMILLQRDIERLLDLVPVAANSTVEAREFNRRYADDVAHISAFQRTLFETGNLPGTAYWAEAIAEPLGQKLARKLTQFRSRGVFVRYDLEPFNEEDWTILFSGMGCRPERYDRRYDALDQAETDRQLLGLKQAISQLVAKMPPHDVYMTNLKRYLEKQRNG